MSYPVLEHINTPSDLRSLSIADLEQLAISLREFIQTETATKAGHIKSSLGVVELSIALHYHFQTPEDILIWDVGHQAYAHKVLCGRRTSFHTNRQKGGISGFTKRSESEYDPFGSGHSSSSISALAGFIKAAELDKIHRKHIAVIGDGAITGGQAFEAINYLGEEQANCLIVFNDNQSSIDENVGALQARRSYQFWIEALGFKYFNTEKGNSIEALLLQLKQMAEIDGPIFWHIHTEKALGYKPELKRKTGPEAPSFQAVFGDWVLKRLAADPKLVVLSPAMLAGANLSAAKAAYPKRVIDVGIAEQNVVTMAAGLAASGFKPIVHLYSTFSQRAVDQIIHDVALQNLQVTFILDRAGYVGEDGPTHHGMYDQSILADVPNLALGAPANGKALIEMLNWATDDAQSAVLLRYPKASFEESSNELWRSYRPHWWQSDSKSKVLVSYGSLAPMVQAVAEKAAWGHLHIPVFRPAPLGDLQEQLKDAQEIILVDENPAAGSIHGDLCGLITDGKIKASYRAVLAPRVFSEHASRAEQLRESGFCEGGLLEMCLK